MINKKTNLLILLVITITILTLSISVFGKDNSNSSGYKKQLIFVMKWGDGGNEVGLKSEEHEYERFPGKIVKYVSTLGPRNIEIDGAGNIYIGDRINRKIVKYDKNSKTIEKLESNDGFLNFMADREQAGLYIFNTKNNTVDIVIPGKERFTKNLCDEVVEDIKKKRVEIKNRILKRIGKKDIYFDSTEQIEDTTNAFDPSIIKYVWPDINSIKFYNLNKIGASCDEVLHKTNLHLAKEKYLGIDNNNNVYYLLELIPRIKQRYYQYYVAKLDIKACKIEIIPLEFDNYKTRLDDMVTVDKNGNIYQILYKGGMRILKWSKQVVYPQLKEIDYAKEEKKYTTPEGNCVNKGCHVEKSTFKHGAISVDGCDKCHPQHDSTIVKKFIYNYRLGSNARFDTTNYELCFKCHSKDIVLDSSTVTLTDFRNGEKNLHFIHVNKNKKTCTTCHELHSPNLEKCMTRPIPEATMWSCWQWPVHKFIKTPTGGECKVGCHRQHKQRVYNRENPVDEKEWY